MRFFVSSFCPLGILSSFFFFSRHPSDSFISIFSLIIRSKRRKLRYCRVRRVSGKFRRKLLPEKHRKKNKNNFFVRFRLRVETSQQRQLFKLLFMHFFFFFVIFCLSGHRFQFSKQLIFFFERTKEAGNIVGLQ